MRGIISRNVTPAIFQQACQAMIDYDVRDRLDRITRPTLVMVGSDDNLTPLHQEPSGAGMQYMVDHIPGAELAIVPNAGHAHLFERPARIVPDHPGVPAARPRLTPKHGPMGRTVKGIKIFFIEIILTSSI